LWGQHSIKKIEEGEKLKGKEEEGKNVAGTDLKFLKNREPTLHGGNRSLSG